MRPRRASPHRNASPLTSSALLPLLLSLLILAPQPASTLRAQSTSTQPTPSQATPTQPAPAPPPNDPRYTLHVYSRLVQIPTLVLSPSLQPLPPIDPHSFNVSIDTGPLFRPNRGRLEGDDPITLAILLDVSGDQSSLLPVFSQSLSAWATQSLRPHDRVSIYAIDCDLIRTTNNEPPNPSVLQRGLDAAITSPITLGNKKHGTCGNSILLWNSMVVVMKQLAQLPGRRVLLVVSNGFDGHSTVKQDSLKAHATVDAVTIFAIAARTSLIYPWGRTMNSICEESGGILLITSPQDLLQRLDHFIDLLRKRYVLSFYMPAEPTPGTHIMHVTIDHTDAFIRPSGISVPLPDPTPTDIPSDAPYTPAPGTAPPMQPHP